MSTAPRNATHRYVARDPLALARDLFTWDPIISQPSPRFSPPFEVKETAEAYLVRADLPGVAEANLEIAVHNSVLTVSGSRAADERAEGEAFSLYERPFGAFTRSFALPETADGERIAAKLEAGVLTLTIAKKAQAKPRKITLG